MCLEYKGEGTPRVRSCRVSQAIGKLPASIWSEVGPLEGFEGGELGSSPHRYEGPSIFWLRLDDLGAGTEAGRSGKRVF